MSYIPYQHNYQAPNYYPQAYATTAQGYKPKTSVDSVKIDIINPKASLEPNSPLTPQPSPYVYNPAPYPPHYYHPSYYYPPPNAQNIYNNYNPQTNQHITNPVTPSNQPQPVPQPQPQPTPQQQPPQPNQQQPPQQPNQPNQQQPQKPKEPEKPKEQPKQIGNIPDSLVAAIDKGLSDPNPEVRIKAATKLLKTFESNPDAKDNPALTVLLNRVLKDPHQNVRLFGEIALQTGAANGDTATQNVLTDMTSSKKAYGQDAIAANGILLDMAGKQPGKNLNVVT